MFVMTVTQPPEPIVVEIASDGPQWWEVVGALAPFAVLLAAALATVTAFATLRQRATADRASLEQKRRADDRAEWWRRTQWAIDAATYPRPADTPRVTAAKARLRVALDQQLGRKTPQSVKDVAEGKPQV